MTDANNDDALKERKKLYKKSLNLPKTGFPMKANLVQNEPASIKRWAKLDVYNAVLTAREEAPPFRFHDGPPYANGTIHVGHLLNKVLKDLVVRTRSMAGYHCPYVPGWDCHGLPIEHKVLTELTESGKVEKLQDLPEDTYRMAVRRECSRYAQKFKKLQAEQMVRLMTLADYENPYMTMSPEYEAGVLEVFAGLVDEGLIYRDLKPVHWSIANETALAEAELEYHDKTDPSIYVWFEAVDKAAVASAFGVDAPDGPVHFMIWTTTPWTLPANLLIAVHERYEYSLVELGGKVGVVASELASKVALAAGTEARELGRVKGSDLVGLAYTHPFIEASERTENAWRVVTADYVTLEDGTGLVHTAPGHGADDYLTGLEQNVPVYCPVQADGTYDDTVPENLRGVSIWDANKQIVDALVASGHMVHHFEYLHSYPHDWRSKTPTIFRATEQWFAAVDEPTRSHQKSLRAMALEATENTVRFFPGWGQKRMRGMLESRPDWCLSRQRAWGLPIPAFRLPDGTVLLTAATVRAVAACFLEHGSDAWFEKDPEVLLATWDKATDADAPESLRSGSLAVAELQKMYDIFDVWFESGSSWHSVMQARGQAHAEGSTITDLYLEGSDQHRGWFQASLLPALGMTGRSPFRDLLTHGFMIDRDGRKISKSLGNTLEVEDLLRDYGADVCRWWVAQLAYENDIKVDIEIFDASGDAYRKVRNTLRFLLGNLADFDAASDSVAPERLASTSLDRWALERASELAGTVKAAYEAYEFRRATLAIFDFCNDTLSSQYLDAVKDRLYCDAADSPRRRSAQTAMFEIARTLIPMLAPILPHTADEAWRDLLGIEKNDPTTVHTETFLPLDIEADPRWEQVGEVRLLAQKAIEEAKASGIENPLDAGLVLADPNGELADFLADLPDVLGVSRVSLVGDGAPVSVVDLRDQPRCERSWRRDETVKERSDGGFLSDRDAQAVGIS